MFKLAWIFGLVILFFVFLFINTKLTKKIDSLNLIEEKTKKDKVKLFTFQVLDKLLSAVLLLYFLLVIFTIVGLMALFIIIIFN